MPGPRKTKRIWISKLKFAVKHDCLDDMKHLLTSNPGVDITELTIDSKTLMMQTHSLPALRLLSEHGCTLDTTLLKEFIRQDLVRTKFLIEQGHQWPKVYPMYYYQIVRSKPFKYEYAKFALETIVSNHIFLKPRRGYWTHQCTDQNPICSACKLPALQKKVCCEQMFIGLRQNGLDTLYGFDKNVLPIIISFYTDEIKVAQKFHS